MINYQEIRKRLRPMQDVVFYIPLSEDEVVELEKVIGFDFPDYYREFLLHFGFQQDFVPGLFTSKEEFIEQNGYLKESMADYLMIGDNGGEDFWVLRTEKVRSQRVFNWIGDTVEKTDFNFEDLIDYALEQLEDFDIEFLNNADKSWCVQFAITTTDEASLYSTLPLVADGEWKSLGKSDAGVDESIRDIKLNNQPMSLRRLNYDEWSAPTYFIDYKESIDSVMRHGLIKQWTAILKDKYPEFDLIDYGILPTDFEME
ncbi:SMI1/KNR4 family protein [Myroides sp. N17-2]|uniref:SMI1/KNR4 family protein n=1 Tax=Myroides sp. N17-2 TaxID=2030799 RepID=UPI000EFA8191|nr:SMI1/KNR4 family protein [Myroides sp. N17-2]